MEFDQKARPGAFANCSGLSSTHKTRNNRDRVVGFSPRANGKEIVTRHDTSDFERRDNQCGVTIDGHHEHGEPLEGHRFVTGEPRKVRPYGKQANVDPMISHF